MITRIWHSSYIHHYWRRLMIVKKRFKRVMTAPKLKRWPPHDPERKYIVDGVCDQRWLNSHRPYLSVWSKRPEIYERVMDDHERCDWRPVSLEERR